MKILFATILILFSMSSVASSPETCGVSSEGVVTPLSTEICPDDLTLIAVHSVYPKITEQAVRLFDLKNADAFLDRVDATSAFGSSRTDLFQSYTTIVASFLLWLLRLVWVVQLGMIVTATIKDGKLGGNQYGSLSTVLRLLSGTVLFIPYGDDSFLISVLAMGGIIASIAIANLLLSTVLYYYQSWMPETSGESVEFHGVSTSAPKFARSFIEDYSQAIACQQAMRLAHVVDGIAMGGRNISALANQYGSTTGVSDVEDQVNSTVVRSSDEKSLLVSHLPFIDSQNGGSMVCGKFQFELTGLNKITSDYINSGGDSWPELTELLVESEGMFDRIGQYLTEKLIIGGLNPEATILKELTPFYQQLMLNAIYTDIEELTKVSEGLAELSRAKHCYENPTRYMQSQEAIKALKSGRLPATGMDLSCAKLDGAGQLVSFTQAHAPFMNPKSEGYDEGDDSLLHELKELLETHEMLEEALALKLLEMVAASTYELRKEHVQFALSESIVRTENLRYARGLGLLGFSMMLVGLHAEAEQLMNSRLMAGAVSPRKELFIEPVVNLPLSYVQNEANFETVRLFSSVDLALRDADVDEGATDGYFTTFMDYQIALHKIQDLEGYITSELNSVATGVGVSSFEFTGLSTDGAEQAAYILAFASLGDFFNANFGSVAKSYRKDGETDSDMQIRFLRECLSGTLADADNYTLRRRCEFQQRHPVVAGMEMGKDLIQYGLFFIVADIAKRLVNMAKDNPNGSVSDHNRGNFTQNLKTALLYDTDSNKAVIYAGLIMVVIGVFFAFIMPLMFQVIAALMYLGWYMYAIVLVPLSPLLLLSYLLLKGQDEAGVFAEKNLANIAINLVLKPFLILLSLLISWVMMQVIYRMASIMLSVYVDSMMTSLGAPWYVAIFIKALTLIALIYAFYAIMYWAITKPPQVLNMAMERMGGDNIVSKEDTIKSVLGATGYAALQGQISTMSESLSGNRYTLKGKVGHIEEMIRRRRTKDAQLD